MRIEWLVHDDSYDWICEVCKTPLAETSQGYSIPIGIPGECWDLLAVYFTPETFTVCESCIGGFCGYAELRAEDWFTVRLPELVAQYKLKPRALEMAESWKVVNE